MKRSEELTVIIELDLIDKCPSWCRTVHERRERLPESTVRKHVSESVMVTGSVGGTPSFVTVARVMHRGRGERRHTWETDYIQLHALDGYIPLTSAQEVADAIARLGDLKA